MDAEGHPEHRSHGKVLLDRSIREYDRAALANPRRPPELRGLLRALFRRARARAASSPDPRLETDPWLGKDVRVLGDRYQLGADAPDGARLLRRTGAGALQSDAGVAALRGSVGSGEYEVRGDVAAAKALLDARVAARLSALGLGVAAEVGRGMGRHRADPPLRRAVRHGGSSCRGGALLLRGVGNADQFGRGMITRWLTFSLTSFPSR